MAGAFILCLGVGFLYANNGTERQAITGFIVGIAVSLTLAAVFYRLGRSSSRKMFRKEALAVIGLGWLLATLLGSIPYLVGHWGSPDWSVANAIFESSSGLTTTGATVFTGFEDWPRSLLFWRGLSQWIGGLGVVVFFVAVLSFIGVGAKILFSSESSAHSTDLASARVQHGVLQILYFYLGLSAVIAASYHVAGMGWYDAVFHMFTTISTGGFSTYDASFAAFQSPLLEWLCIVFMALGGTSFLVMLRLVHRDFRAVRESTETKGYFVLLILSGLIAAYCLLLFEHVSAPLQALRVAMFQVTSIMTTTGYATVDFDLWPPVLHSLLLVVMIIGGSSGSTAGGLKVIRLIVGAKVCLNYIERSFRSNVMRPIKINGHHLNTGARESIITYIVIITLIGHMCQLAVAMLQPELPMEDVYSVVFASLYNIGPGFGKIGPTQTYGFLHDYTKYLLSLVMVMGRLELFAVLALFSPSLWRKFE